MKAGPPDLIVIKGAPGVGKSTAAKILAALLPSSVRIEVDTLRSMVTAVNWTDQAEHRAVLTLAARLASGFLRADYAPVIMVDTFSGDKIEGFLECSIAEHPRARVSVHVLYAAAGVLRDRVRRREPGGFRDLDILMSLNEEAVRCLKPFETLIDTSTLTPSETAQAILAAI